MIVFLVMWEYEWHYVGWGIMSRQRLTRFFKWWATTFPVQHERLCPLSVQLRWESVLFFLYLSVSLILQGLLYLCIVVLWFLLAVPPPHKHTKDTLEREEAWVFSFLVTVHRKIKQTYGEKKCVLTQDWVVHLFSLNLKCVLLVELSSSDDCCSVIHFKECPFFYFCPFWQAGNKKSTIIRFCLLWCFQWSSAEIQYVTLFSYWESMWLFLVVF